MDIGLTTDMVLIKEILGSPEIWERAAEDDQKLEDYQPGYDDYCNWLICKQNHTNIGIILLHADTCITLKMHIFLIKEHRKKASEMVNLFFEWFMIKTQALKLTASIPACYQDAIKFAIKSGLKEEGINRASYIKDGEVYDQHNLGITRNEISEVIKWESH